MLSGLEWDMPSEPAVVRPDGASGPAWTLDVRISEGLLLDDARRRHYERACGGVWTLMWSPRGPALCGEYLVGGNRVNTIIVAGRNDDRPLEEVRGVYVSSDGVDCTRMLEKWGARPVDAKACGPLDDEGHFLFGPLPVPRSYLGDQLEEHELEPHERQETVPMLLGGDLMLCSSTECCGIVLEPSSQRVAQYAPRALKGLEIFGWSIAGSGVRDGQTREDGSRVEWAGWQDCLGQWWKLTYYFCALHADASEALRVPPGAEVQQ